MTDLVDVTVLVAARAAALRADSSLKLPDALVAASAETAGAGLVTTDQNLASAAHEPLEVELIKP